MNNENFAWTDLSPFRCLSRGTLSSLLPILSTFIVKNFIFCSSASGSISVLPSILHLTLGTLREMSAKTAEKRNPVAVNACLAAIKSIFSTKRYEDKTELEIWDKLLRASLTTVLKQSKPGRTLKSLVIPVLIVTVLNVKYMIQRLAQGPLITAFVYSTQVSTTPSASTSKFFFVYSVKKLLNPGCKFK